MRETKIETVQGYLGTYNSILHPGDTQCLTFLQSDQGPPTQAELNADQNQNKYLVKPNSNILQGTGGYPMYFAGAPSHKKNNDIGGLHDSILTTSSSRTYIHIYS